MKSSQHIIQEEYTRLRSTFEFEFLGLLEIGSWARGEAVSMSDRDLRIVVQSAKPFVLLREHTWPDVPDVEVTYLSWTDLNHLEDITFGLSNIAFIEQCLEWGQYPLNDHTCIYQGQILIDEVGAIQLFRDRYAGILFENIIIDYIRQTDWRINHKLQGKTDFAFLEQRPDKRKLSIPMVHTCCRIARDIAQIDEYRQHARYFTDLAALDAYYQLQWPWFYPCFRLLFAYKTDEEQRKRLFERVESGDAAGQQLLGRLKDATITLWNHFKERVTLPC